MLSVVLIDKTVHSQQFTQNCNTKLVEFRF